MNARARRAREWLDKPLVLTRGGMFAFVTVLGLLASAGVIAGGIALDNAQTANTRVLDERGARRDDRESALRERIAAAERDAAAARRLARLESPSASDIERRLLSALRAIRRNPRLREELGGIITPSGTSADPGAASPRRSSGPRRDRDEPERRRRRDRDDRGGGQPAREEETPPPPPQDPRPPAGAPPAPTTPAPSPAPTGPASPPAVATVTVPELVPGVGVTVCTGLVDINCP